MLLHAAVYNTSWEVVKTETGNYKAECIHCIIMLQYNKWFAVGFGSNSDGTDRKCESLCMRSGRFKLSLRDDKPLSGRPGRQSFPLTHYSISLTVLSNVAMRFLFTINYPQLPCCQYGEDMARPCLFNYLDLCINRIFAACLR